MDTDGIFEMFLSKLSLNSNRETLKKSINIIISPLKNYLNDITSMRTEIMETDNSFIFISLADHLDITGILGLVFIQNPFERSEISMVNADVVLAESAVSLFLRETDAAVFQRTENGSGNHIVVHQFFRVTE